jgi:hypothetical protein
VRLTTFTCLLVLLSGCSIGGLKRTDGSEVVELGIARVLHVDSLVIESEESLSDRVLVGVATGGIVGGAAAAGTEEGISEQQIMRYVVELNSGNHEIFKSRSIAQLGDCVRILSRQGHDFPVFYKVDTAQCVSPVRPSKSIH